MSDTVNISTETSYSENDYSNFYFPEFNVKLGTKTLYPKNVSYNVSETTEKLKTLERPWYDIESEKTEEIVIAGNIIPDELSDYKEMIDDSMGNVIMVEIDGQAFENMYIKSATLNMRESDFYFDYKIILVKVNFEETEVSE